MIEKNNLLLQVCNIALNAGEETLKYYIEDIEVTHKNDSSPLTKADLASNKIIMNALRKLDRTIPILSEESLVEWNERKNWTKYWLVDPLDGTKEFIKKNGEFTVNIALIENNKPILGVIYAPVKSDLYFAQKKNGSYKINSKSKLIDLKKSQKLFVSNQSNITRIIGSRSHSNQSFDSWVNQNFPNTEIVQSGSSLKFCLIAEGTADIYPRFGPTSEWDIAAGHIIVDEAGGRVNTFQNNEINYNLKEDLLNPQFYAIGNYKF
ncbi:3'(2'),5'-bisphosphate nucleotidase CysQ [Alphaproteobacteria bacterium]|nr:3'(2'),5'-bisphosphate nucleotidase CysQ [Alphaproteobacteria bacterium]